jgi:hypothetical protein
VATPALSALLQRLDLSGDSCRRLGPLDREDVAQVLGLYEGGQAARAAAGAVLDATGGLPGLVHQAAADWAQAQAANQAADNRGRLHRVQAKLAEDVGNLQELREHT